MSGDHRTPYKEDALRVQSGTKPDEIREFVRRRGQNPHHVAGLTVWNFNNHELNVDALQRQADSFHHDTFVIPYSVAGVWGYMVTMLPRQIREAEILTYRQSSGNYVPYPNYERLSQSEDDRTLRAELAVSANDELRD